MDKLVWKIGGEAGFGIMTTGLLFSKLASRCGYQIFDSVDYPSLIRGGHNTYEVVLSEEEVSALKYSIDILVCLNKETFVLHRQRLHSRAIIVYDKDDFEIKENSQWIKLHIPLKKLIAQFKGKEVMKNMIALGASTALLKGDLQVLNKLIEDHFDKKGEKVVKENKRFAQAGYRFVKENYPHYCRFLLKKGSAENQSEKVVISGNDGFSLGAVIGDCRFYAAYPMTPSSSVLTTLASWQSKVGMVVRHSEDEIAVINNALGASFSGVRSAVGTSGGGFALMVESISLAGIAELPIVIFLAQRPGPATGMPTWTEQGDLLFAVHAGHGEFPKIVLAPGDVKEMIELTAKAFNLADIYQTPVIILSDKFLSESHKSLKLGLIDKIIKDYQIDRGKTINKPEEGSYLRYAVTKDGISPRLIPGREGFFYQANSYEHKEDSHTTEQSKERMAQVKKRDRKRITYLNNHFAPPRVYGDIDQSEIVFIAWGSIKGPVIEAQKLLIKEKIKTALIHFNHIYPLDKTIIKPLFSREKRYVLVENNFYGQFARLLRQETGIDIKERLVKYDGRSFWPEEIVKGITK